ncbi:MAG TPA: hypothetical protein VIW94_04085 [Acidimicrobiia bacterium]
MELNRLNGCDKHQFAVVGDIRVAACGSCRIVEWADSAGEIDPSEGMAALFGSFQLIGPLDALGSPAPEVLVYRTSSSKKRKSLQAFPAHVWVKAAPDLWLTHDGELLLLATNHRLLFENLTRGA